MKSPEQSSAGRLRAVAFWGGALACLLALLTSAPAAAQIYDIDIVGTWEWVSTEVEGQTPLTPATAGYTEQWEFTAGLDFYKYRDRHRQWQARFSMSEVLTEDETWILTLSILGGDSFTIQQLDNLALVLLSASDGHLVRTTFQRRGPIPVRGQSVGALKAAYMR